MNSTEGNGTTINANTTSTNMTATNATNQTTISTSDIPQLNMTSIQCQTTTSAFLSCTSKNATNSFEENCNGCSNEYDKLLSDCSDDDYSQSSFLFGLSLSCHKEDEKFCQNTADNFACDNCGKYLATKIYTTGYIDTMKNRTQADELQECAKGSTSVRSIMILALVFFSFF